ncbi:hypothetical protein AKJ16_DCAP09556 [Drosera capensis]
MNRSLRQIRFMLRFSRVKCGWSPVGEPMDIEEAQSSVAGHRWSVLCIHHLIVVEQEAWFCPEAVKFSVDDQDPCLTIAYFRVVYYHSTYLMSAGFQLMDERYGM